MDQLLENRIKSVIERSDLEDAVWLVKNVQIETVLQNGPQCGIVALKMALDHYGINLNVDELMQKARDLNFSKNGEMFYAEYLFKLASCYYEKAEIKNSTNELDLLNDLLGSSLILLPYDCDANFEPCNKNGLKAHWTLLTGFLLPIAKTKFTAQICHELNCENSESLIINLSDLNLVEDQIEKLRDSCLSEAGKDSIWTLCKQGKSRINGVWNLSKLIESNLQLRQVDDAKCDVHNFIRPLDGNLENTLASKYIVFKK